MAANQFDGFLKTNPTATGVLAGVVTMSGQVAAQMEMPPVGCRVVALLFALLLACYQVAIAQRRPRVESAVLVPIVAVILFTTGWGANGLLYETSAKSAKASAQPVAAVETPHIGRWIADAIVPSAHAQSAPAANQEKQKKGGWKKW
jgi:hypothetical protein